MYFRGGAPPRSLQMDCLSPEQLVTYLRGGGADPRGLEAHVRDCPACAMELLLARETLGEGRVKTSRPATDRLRLVPPKSRPGVWIPWVAAAAVLVAALLFAVLGQKSSAPQPNIAKQPEVKPKTAPIPTPEQPKPIPEPPKPDPKPEPLPPKPDPKPDPKPEPKPEPIPPKPEPKPDPKPEPKPEPKKPNSTEVERGVVAKVLHSVGGAASSVGRKIHAGEALTTARQEFLHV